VREIGYRFRDHVGAGDVARSVAHSCNGVESGVTVATAGRLMLSRPREGLLFAELRDWTGGISVRTVAALSHPNFEGSSAGCRSEIGSV